VRVALNKVEGITSVNVTLKRGVASIELKPGNTVSIAQLRKTIKDAGYTTQGAVVTARGTVVSRGQEIVLDVTGTSTRLNLKAEAGQAATLANLRRAAGASGAVSIEATGTIPPPEGNPKATDTLVLRAFTITP
jgi:copper chaperone CopZ